MKQIPDVLNLNADVITSKDGQSTLVFGQRNVLRDVEAKVSANNGVTLSSNGVVPAFNSVLQKLNPDQKLSRGSLVLELENNSKVTVDRLAAEAVKAPSQVVFLVEKGDPTELSSSQALQYLLSGFDGKNFKPFLETSSVNADTVKTLQKVLENTKSYIMPTTSSKGDATAMLQQVLQGNKPSGTKAFDSKSVEEPLKKYFAATYPGVSL